MAENNCKTCSYFVGNDLGSCRRFPQYQMRHENEWCGEFAKSLDAVAKTSPESSDSGVFSTMSRKLIELPVVTPPKRGRPNAKTSI